MLSALLTTYNRRAHVCRAIDSILAQTRPVDELVIVDDGSSDGTQELVQGKYGQRVRYVYQQNQGVAGARRRAVEEARGTWVAFLDSDDEWIAGRNRAFMELIERLPDDVGWVIGNTEVIRDGGSSATIYDLYAREIDRGPRILEDSMSVQTPFQLGLMQSSVIRRSALLEVNCFSEKLGHSEDFLIGVQVACLYRLAILPDVVTRLYRTSDLEASSADRAHRQGPDYSRARMIAFRCIVETGRRSPYGEWYGESARSLCQALAARGEIKRGLLWEQFRYGMTPKSVLFACAGIFGRPGIRAWNFLTGQLRRTAGGADSSAESTPKLI